MILWLVATLSLAVSGWHEAGHKETRRRIIVSRLGVLAAFLVGAATFGYEVLKGQRDAKQEANRMRTLLGKMESVRVSFRASVPIRNNELSRYRLSLVSRAETCFSSMPAQGGSAGLQVRPLCQPRRENYPIAHSVLSIADLCLDFFREPIDPRVFEPCGLGSGPRPDLSMKIFAGFEDGLDLDYDDARKRFLLEVLNRQSESQTWKGNGSIASVTDLAGSQLFVTLANFSQGYKGFSEIYHAAEIDSLALDSGIPRVSLDLSDQTMNHGRDLQGMPFYYTYLYLDAKAGIASSKTRISP